MSVEISPDCFGHRSRAAARAVTRVFNAILRPLNLNVGQVTMLAALKNNDGQTLSALGEYLQLDPSALQRNLKTLERRGLVVNDQGRGRRGCRSMLTADGLKIVEQAAPLWEHAQIELNRVLGAEATETLKKLETLATVAGELGRELEAGSSK